MKRSWLISIIFFLFPLTTLAQEIGPESITIGIGESAWWCGVINHGEMMPLKDGYHADFNNNYGNQIQPLLISDQGQTIWSEQAFIVDVTDDTIYVRSGDASLIYDQSGIDLKGAFQFASKTYFPPTGQMPDELLFSAPQYNTWIELMYDQNQEDILEYASAIVQNGYPTGVLMIDDNWQENYGKWDFHQGRFSDPGLMVDSLHHMGYKVMLWICPFVSPDCDVFRMLEAKDMLLKDSSGMAAIVRWWNGASGLLDLSNPETMLWFKEQLDYLQDTYHVDGFKFDEGDFDFYKNLVAKNSLTSPANISQDQCEYYARVGLDYPLNEYRAMWKMAGQPLVNRLRDKAHNWSDLQTLIPDILLQRMVGYNFTCPDMIGGGEFTSFLAGSVIDQNLIVRSAQVHALMPMMQFSVATWRILDDAHKRAVDLAVEIREGYTPLIMKLANESAFTGEPIVRSMEYIFPGYDYSDISDQFMLGDDVLVAPIVEKGAEEREILIPEGKWRDLQGKKVKGPTRIRVTVGLEDIPIYERVK